MRRNTREEVKNQNGKIVRTIVLPIALILSLAINCQPVLCEGKKEVSTKEDRATGVKTPQDLVSLFRSYTYSSEFYLRFP